MIRIISRIRGSKWRRAFVKIQRTIIVLIFNFSGYSFLLNLWTVFEAREAIIFEKKNSEICQMTSIK